MKKIVLLLFLLVFLLSVKPAKATVQFGNCCKVNCEFLSKNPQIVACYESGTHGIVGQSETHTGADFVKLFKNGGIFQFFCGFSQSEGLHREISLWQPTKNKKCPQNWILLEDPHPEWGDYLKPGVDYCVKTITLPCPTCKGK